MAEHTLLRKLESLWGVPIFYADETGENIQSLGVFSEKQNPLTVSEELRRSLICQAKEQNVPAICKISGKIYFFCIQSGEKILSVRPCLCGTAKLCGNSPVLQKIPYVCEGGAPSGQNDPEQDAEFRKFSV